MLHWISLYVLTFDANTYREDQAFALRFDKKKMLTKNKSVVWVGIIVVLVTLVARLLFMHHPNSTQSFPYGRDGKNIKHAGQMVDTMYLSITDRMTLVATHTWGKAA